LRKGKATKGRKLRVARRKNGASVGKEEVVMIKKLLKGGKHFLPNDRGRE